MNRRCIAWKAGHEPSEDFLTTVDRDMTYEECLEEYEARKLEVCSYSAGPAWNWANPSSAVEKPKHSRLSMAFRASMFVGIAHYSYTRLATLLVCAQVVKQKQYASSVSARPSEADPKPRPVGKRAQLQNPDLLKVEAPDDSKSYGMVSAAARADKRTIEEVQDEISRKKRKNSES